MSRDNQRTCQPFTACCEGWLQIVIEGQAVYPGKPCPHCTSTGCNDYENRPLDPCIEFVCAWREDGSSMPEWMKPNNAKVIVMRDHGVWRGMPVDLAVPVGRRIPPRALKYLEEFSRTHSRPLIYVEQIVENGQFTKRQAPCVYGPPEFQQERRHERRRVWLCGELQPGARFPGRRTTHYANVLSA